jgi:hypothetical protein
MCGVGSEVTTGRNVGSMGGMWWMMCGPEGSKCMVRFSSVTKVVFWAIVVAAMRV